MTTTTKTNTALVEPSLRDLIAAIEQTAELRRSAGAIGSAQYGRSPSGWTVRQR